VTISRRNNMVIIRSSDPKAMEDIRALVRRLDVPTSLVLLEVKVLSLDLGDGFSSMFDYQSTRTSVPAAAPPRRPRGSRRARSSPPHRAR
jgi:type II secretory pathway component GspD/PulD (secretin)